MKDQMGELRRLIIGPEKVQLERLQERLDDPTLHARDISGVLPEAIVLGTKKDNKLVTALMPTVEEIVKASIKKDIRTFVDALFPVIGPAIRKAISETFKQMIQSLNKALEQSFSWQGLKWRMEAIRTGKTFAEVVLVHSLLYRVDQVFLIHRKTGLLLHHVSAEAGAFQEADLVSGMLTAIQDFIRDSFNMESDQTLDTIQIGDVTVWIEQGPAAILACAIRGNAPEDLRIVFRNALENIHLEKGDAMDAFEGDTATFESIRHHLESCLHAQYKEKKRKFSPFFILLLVIIITALGSWAFWSVRNHLRWTEFLEKLDAEPGIVVTIAEKYDGKYHISGLRDPLGRDPAEILARSEMASEKVIYRLEPYQALLPEFILKRAKTILRPPETVLLTLEKGTLIAQGTAPYQWIIDVRKLACAVPGVLRFNERQLIVAELKDLDPPKTVSLTLQDGILTATGPAPHWWIIETRKKVPKISGVVQYDETGLKDSDLLTLAALKGDLEKEVFLFKFNATKYTRGQVEDLNRILNNINHFIDLALTVDRYPYIEVIGHTDTSGTKRHNMELSLQRAEQFRHYLLVGGIEADYVSAVGVGTAEPLRKETTDQDKAWNRSITFRVHLNK